MADYELRHWGIKGMKWGVRRYQNEDGSLTDAGKKRYDRDQRENSGKKKGERVGSADPNRWVREDRERTKRVLDETSHMANKLKSMNEQSMRSKSKPRMDLSSMTDKEMRDRINRELLERQYSDMFSPKNTRNGREVVNNVLDVASNVLAVGGSALSIALALKALKG